MIFVVHMIGGSMEPRKVVIRKMDFEINDKKKTREGLKRDTITITMK